MKKNLEIIPISKIFSIINSCRNIEQTESCKKLIKLYIISIRSHGVIDYELVESALNIKVQEKIEELEIVENFCTK